MPQNNQTYGQVFGNSVGGAMNNAGNILQVLLGLAQGGGPVDAGMRAGQGAMNTPVGQNPLPNAAAATVGPYQKGVEKALRTAGENHATEALQMGVPPTQIQDHPLMQPPAPMASSEGAMQAPSAQPGQVDQGAQQNVLKMLSGLGSFLFQAGGPDKNGTYQPRQMLGGLLRPGGTAAQLTGQQAANLTPGAQLGLKKAEAEQIPPTQYEQKTLQAGAYAANVTAINDELAKIQTDKQNIVDQMKTALELRNPIEKGLGAAGGQVKQLQQTLSQLNKKESEVHQKMVDLFGKQPNTKGSGSPKSGAKFFSPSTGKYYDATGNAL